MMDTNTVATLYLADGSGWRAIEVNAFWPRTARLSSRKELVAEHCTPVIFLPLDGNPMLEGVDIPLRSYIVRGSCSAMVSEDFPLKRLIAEYHAQTVCRADLFDYGGMELRHWELEVEA